MTVAEEMSRLLLALPLAIAVCRAGGAAARRLGQPPVVGEIAAGILAGPSLVGRLWPHAQAYLLPPAVLDHLDVLGQLGLLAFMFLAGFALDTRHLKGQGRVTVVVSNAGVLVPLLLGGALGMALYGPLAPSGVGRVVFVLFVAVAMSITAFPVLARILTDRGLHRSRLGSLALACAAVDDITAWCLLTLVIAVERGGTPLASLTAAGLVLLYVGVMARLVRPLLARVLRSWAVAPSAMLAVLFCGICLSSFVTDRIGVHPIFGAFMFGVVTPRGHPVVEQAVAVLRSAAVPLLLPLFFLITGLRTDLGLLAADPVEWLWLAAILVVAVVGKWGGVAAAARLSGIPRREALALGALMNCRGLTELIVLGIGLDLGVIGQDLFTMLVLMALLTTAITAPVVAALGHGTRPATEPPDAAGPGPGPGPGDAEQAQGGQRALRSPVGTGSDGPPGPPPGRSAFRPDP
ncbi:Kef-type K+ transport system, membrane component KefB [Streptomyces sp. yr375]|uniref:cation:proton antiporter n=1 Tax=Streptomyces sp. yr375 TaxID=1761906 RepID=UPI0008BBCE4A|nr:cation:proton antiporter [Streptomyces sp. yr375]SER68109.1 Kef-type K+ transport system, membrane component KefB [Streptomyces sp. yr375]